MMAPHHEQDGWCYIRVNNQGWEKHDYNDALSCSRTISSRRVERAVENDNVLRKLQERGWCCEYVSYDTENRRWRVYSVLEGARSYGATLKEAYYRYENCIYNSFKSSTR